MVPRNGRLNLARACGLGALLLASCVSESTPEPFYLEFQNIDGPTVTVTINGQTLARLECQGLSPNRPGAMLGPLRPGEDLPLPWQVTISTSSGHELGQWTEPGTDGPRMLVIRGEQVAELPVGAPVGPAPSTCADD